MTNMLFVTPWKSAANVVYGPGHVVDITDSNIYRLLQSEGKAEGAVRPIRGLAVTALGTTTATIQWTVDQAVAVSNLQYGTTLAYGTQVVGAGGPGPGVITASITGLTSGTTYYYYVNTTVSGGGATLTSPQIANQSFTTL